VKSKTLFNTVLAAGLLCGAVVATPARSDEIVAAHFGKDFTSPPLAVALQLDLFKKHGADISGVLTSDGGGTTLRNMLAGNLPYGEIGPVAVMAAYREGIDIRIIAANSVQVSDILWVTTKNSEIKTMKDLVGKRIGVTSPKSVSKALLEMSLESAQIPLNQVEILPLGAIAAGLTALETGGVHVAFINEPLWAAREDRYRVVIRASDYVKHYTQNVGVTMGRYVKEKPQMLRSILAARREAVDYIFANPDKAAELIAKQYGDTLPVDVAKKAVAHAVSLNFWSRGNIDMLGLQEVVNVMVRQGEWKGPVDWNKLVDQSFLPPDLPKAVLPNS
jgi:NitT/TauT family transport system substrate-binding protein